MLAGEGSDELFAGYMSNVKAYWLHRFSCVIPNAMKKHSLKLPFSHRYRAIMKKSTLRDEEFIESFFQHYTEHDILTLCDWIDLNKAGGRDLWDEIGFNEMQGSFLEKLLYFQMKTYLVALLMKQDKMSMAASIETRVPFLDHQFVELSCRIPDKYKIRMRQGKYILKKACEGLLTKDIIFRKKMGFPVPIDKWFRKKGNPFIAVLLDPSTKSDSFLNFKCIENTVEDFHRGAGNVLHNLWTFLNIELWRREFLQKHSASSQVRSDRALAGQK
jgi:asparagine synthase (glutamine-hydrolysing)